MAACMKRIPLAFQAVEETHIGLVEDKVIKNHYASEYIYNHYKNEKTCGVIEVHTETGIKKIAESMGILAAIIPCTNPTSTTIFKLLLSLKTRNGIIICPHPRAKACTIESARIVYEAAVASGAPRDIIAWIDHPDAVSSSLLMRHPDIALIIATGGPGMIRSGTIFILPCFFLKLSENNL